MIRTAGDTDDPAALRRCVSDVVALSTLSAVWAGASRTEIAGSLAQVLRQTLDADAVYVGLRASPTGARCEAYDARDRDGALVARLRDAAAPWLDGSASELGAAALDAGAVTIPVGINGEHGAIVAASAAGFPSETDRLLLNLAANQATLALLADRVRDEQHVADTLQRLGIAIAGELDTEAVIQTVTDEATQLTGAEFGAFFYNVTNAAGESYMLYTLSGASRDAFSRFPMPRNTAVFAPTFSGDGIVRSADITRDARFGHNPPYRGMPEGHLPVRSYLAVPVRSRTGKVHGGLFFGHQEVDMFLERHERLAAGIAAWAAIAMDNGYLYAEAQRANRAKDQFLATLSHELRTPLNALIGWISMVRRPEVMSPGGVPKAWAAIDRNTEALVGLVEDLLDVSRIATGKVRLADAPVDLADVARDTARAAEPQCADKRLHLVLNLPEVACVVRGDVARLRQVVANLLANAVKFTAGGGRIAVTVDASGDDATLIVEDTGIGIHPDFLPHVFERFRQGDTDLTGGLGLGLAIVKSLVMMHGGTVSAESDGIGQGARFTITLPRARTG